MKQNLLLLMIILFLIGNSQSFSQEDWTYSHQISFSVEDSLVRPYLCDIDENGKLYVVSSKATGPTPLNAIYYANEGDTLFTKFINYDANGDSDTLAGNIGAIRGISTLGSDLFVSFSQPYPKYKPNTVAGIYRYINADTNTVEKYGAYLNFSGTGGYGSFIHGLAMSPDTVAFTGVSFGTSIRTFNWSHIFDVAAYASYIPPFDGAQWNENNPVEPGGEHTDGVDIIRDIALVPGDDYKTNTSRVFTSRNSYSADQTTGGIAVWEGGVQTEPVGYEPERLVDFDGYLAFSDSYPYGIHVDTEGTLWVAGIDSTRRWVKGFELDGVNAIATYELPSSTSFDDPVVEGAPMNGPCDVVLNKETSKAYVIDMWSKTAFVFTRDVTANDDEANALPTDYILEQNYPNPFNPSTKLSFTLPKASDVKLVISNVLGKEVAEVYNGKLSAGNHNKVFDASNLTSGVYFYSLITDGVKITKKMMLVK